MSLPSQSVFSLQGLEFHWINRSEPRPIAAMWLPKLAPVPPASAKKLAGPCSELADGCLWLEANDGTYWHPEARFLAKLVCGEAGTPSRKTLYLPCQLDLGPKPELPWWDWLSGSLDPQDASTWLLLPAGWLTSQSPGALIAIQ